MRVNKAKFIRKYLRFYKLIFKLDSPYNIILDGNFIFHALKYKQDILERIRKLLSDNHISLFVQQSIFNELEQVGESASRSLEYCSKYCTIINDSACIGDNPSEKLYNYLEALFQDRKNSSKSVKHYLVATQDKDLRVRLASIPGTPIIYFNKVSIILESPSSASRSYSLHIESEKTSLKDSERENLSSIKTPSRLNIVGGQSTDAIENVHDNQTSLESTKLRLKRKASAPNPLSSLPPSHESKSFKKRRINKFKR